MAKRAEGQDTLASAAWEKIFKDHPEIEQEIALRGVCEISANLIRNYREPRLMAKHDTSTGVPEALQSRKLNILPISRSSYVLGHFQLFKKFPATRPNSIRHASLPPFETLSINDISSEANAINALLASGILSDFINEDNLIETFNGRMGSGDFDFHVACNNNEATKVHVRGAQIEIDGGFESDKSVIIMEAKNIKHNDFHVRQLYYPYRRYLSTVKKPIRLVFSQYSNFEYRLFEYRFANPEDYSSIELLKSASYSLADKSISIDDLKKCWEQTVVKTTDPIDSTIPFIQADRMEWIIALMERLEFEDEGLSTEHVSMFLGMKPRQANYYASAGQYLGVFEKESRGYVSLSDLGQSIVEMRYYDRILELARLLFRHAVFHDAFADMIQRNSMKPDKNLVMSLMRKYQVCNDTPSMIKRRASSVCGWLRWLVSNCE